MMMCICIDGVGEEVKLQLHHLVISTPKLPEGGTDVLMLILIFVWKSKTLFSIEKLVARAHVIICSLAVFVQLPLVPEGGDRSLTLLLTLLQRQLHVQIHNHNSQQLNTFQIMH